MSRNLEVNERAGAGGAAVFDVVGDLTVPSGAEVLVEKVREKIEAGGKLIIFNLEQCRRVDSAGLGELVTCLVTATRAGATLRLANIPTQIQGVMKLTNVYKVFEIYPTEEAAINKQG